jgi:cell division protein FtsI (penicillin-binding protein 3)
MMGWLKRGRRKTADGADAPIVVEGARKSGGGRTKNRIVMTMSVFFAIYAVMAGRLVYYGTHQPEDNGPPAGRPTAARPDIVDRNGEVLATDIKTASLYAEPRRIVDIDEAIDKLATVVPDIESEQV